MHTVATDPIQTKTSTARAWYTLAVLILIMVFNQLDRYVMAVLVQPIKRDLALSDTQIGILTGFAFSAFYALAALPLARLADGGRRRQVIWMSTFVWSVMTAACGATQSFFQLLVARFLVGAGEAGALPASQSLICDVFPPSRRNTALGVFAGSAAIGVFIAFAVGAVLEQSIGWRWTFVAAGLPGLLLIVLFVTTVRDPRKAPPAPIGRIFSYSEAIRVLFSNRILLSLYLGAGLLAFFQLALPQWLPAFLERSHELSRAEIGIKMASVSAPAMLIGLLIGGPIADALARRNPLWPSRMILVMAVSAVFPAAGIMLATGQTAVFAFIALTAFCSAVSIGPIFALAHTVVAPDERATAIAGAIIATSFIGLGLMPFLTGVASDMLADMFGRHALRWSLMTIIMIAGLPMAYAFWRVTSLLARQPPPAL